jgi:pantoate--beta-alanine ligase
MVIARTVAELRSAVAALRRSGKTIGLVPTMGCLHAGHLTLVDLARREATACVVSIFVNPTQFGPKEDFAKYPRPFDDDCRLCEGRGVDVVFAPGADFYAADSSTWVTEESVSQGLCGDHRPGHFRGVATVVLKLLLACGCDTAVFGRKDLQQLAVIRRMVRDLDVPVRVVAAPTEREADGLAMSSRNRYLAPEDRARARVIPESLRRAQALVAAGERSAAVLLSAVRGHLATEPALRLQYLEVVDADTLRSISVIVPGRSVVALAAFLGDTRLIDNVDL